MEKSWNQSMEAGLKLLKLISVRERWRVNHAGKDYRAKNSGRDGEDRQSLEYIPTSGFMRQMLILYLKEKTGLGKQKIETILDAIA
ncbi:hypothetical protein DRP05_12095, partial [Archaeoglobales archaeon]